MKKSLTLILLLSQIILQAQNYLPFACGTSRYCTQGNNGSVSHYGKDYYAYDFSMPIGTAVYAMKSGTVVDVEESYANYNCSNCTSCWYQVNRIVIQIAGGNKQLYLHLNQNGVVVNVGSYVNQGTLIGYSGSSGCSTGAHLHVAEMNNTSCSTTGPWYCQSVPLTFADVSTNGGVPQQGLTYTSGNCVSSCTPPATPSTTFGGTTCPGTQGSLSGTDLTFNTVSGATGYEVSVSKYPYGSSCLISGYDPFPCTLLSGQLVMSAALQPGMLYRWNMYATSSCGNSSCYSGVSSTKYFYIPPTISPSSSQSICSGGSVQFSTSPSSVCSGGFVSYQWYKNGTAISGANSTTYSATTSGNYYVQYNFSGSTNCSSASIQSATVSVTVNPLPTAPSGINASTTSAICAGTNVNLNAVGSLSSGATWKWYSSSCGSSLVGSGSGISVAPNNTTTYYLRAENSCGNSLCVQHTVTVTPTSTPTFTQVTPICAGEPLASLPTTSNNGIVGTWSPSINNMNTTTYTFTPNASFCANSTNMTITVNSPIQPIFNSVSAICSGSTINPLPTISNNGINGVWSPAVNNLNTTTYTFTPNAGQCATASNITITVNPMITPLFTQVSAICAGGVLSPLPTTSNNGIVGTWSPALNNMNTTTYTFTPTSGCATNTTMTITVNTSNITPTFNSIPPVCEGSVITPLPTTSINGINGSWLPALNNLVTTTYTFTPIAGQCATSNTLSIVVNSPVTPSFTPTSPICSGSTVIPLPTTSTNGILGTWQPILSNLVSQTYTFTPNSGQCATSTSMPVTVTTSITPTFNINNSVCSGSASITLPTISNNGITGTWFPPNISSSTTSIYTFSPSPGQCGTTTSITVGVIPTPTLNVSVTPPSASVCLGDSVLLVANGNALTYNWSGGVSNGVSFIPVMSDTFTVTASDGSGCDATSAVSIQVSNNTVPSISVASSQSSVSNGILVSYQASINPSTISNYFLLWYKNSSLIATTVSPTDTFSYIASHTVDTICVKLVPLDGCFVPDTVISNCLSLANVTSTQEEDIIKEALIYPNPVQDVLYIDLKNGQNVDIKIMDIAGKIIVYEKKSKGMLEIKTHNWAKGIYYLELTIFGKHRYKKIAVN